MSLVDRMRVALKLEPDPSLGMHGIAGVGDAPKVVPHPVFDDDDEQDWVTFSINIELTASTDDVHAVVHEIQSHVKDVLDNYGGSLEDFSNDL